MLVNNSKDIRFRITRCLYKCAGFCVGVFKKQPIKTANEWAAKVDAKAYVKRMKSATKRHPLN